MNQSTAILAEKISTLGPEQVREVEDFIDFVRLRSEERGLAGAAAAVSSPAFETVWNNPEDDAYDAL